MESLIKKYALQNAIRFNGTATTGAVIGHILGEKPELKKKIKEIAKKVNESVKEVNSLKTRVILIFYKGGAGILC